MIDKVELLKVFEKASLSAFEADMGYSDSGPGMVYLKSNSIEEFLRFTEVNNLKTVLYSYDYNDPEDYQITEEMVEDYDERLVKAIRGSIKEYNKSASALDFARPAELNIYAVYQGCCFTISQEDTWLEDMGILMGDEKLEELIDSCEDIMEEISAEEQQKIDELKGELREYLLTNSEFQQCTNQSLRRAFILKLMKEKPEYKKALPQYLEPVFFAENVWKELKAKKNT